jgi:hypothetical protein
MFQLLSSRIVGWIVIAACPCPTLAQSNADRVSREPEESASPREWPRPVQSSRRSAAGVQLRGAQSRRRGFIRSSGTCSISAGWFSTRHCRRSRYSSSFWKSCPDPPSEARRAEACHQHRVARNLSGHCRNLFHDFDGDRHRGSIVVAEGGRGATSRQLCPSLRR